MTTRLVHVIDNYKAATDVVVFVGEISEAEAYLSQVRASVVAHARERGISWIRIGELLGVSAQAARQRYSRLVAGDA